MVEYGQAAAKKTENSLIWTPHMFTFMMWSLVEMVENVVRTDTRFKETHLIHVAKSEFLGFV